MSTPPIAQQRRSSAIFTFPIPPLDIKNRVGSIEGTEIKILANKIVTSTMMVLAIDIATPKAQSFRTMFEPKSRMFSIVEPISERIAKSLAEANSFAEETPIQIDLMNGENTGVLDQVTDEVLKPYLIEAKNDCMKSWNVEKFSSFAALLSLNRKLSTRELHFEIKMAVNNQPLGKDSGTLADFEEHFDNGLT